MGIMKLKDLAIGDEVTRLLGGIVTMKLRVTEITEETIVCGDWTFHRETGAEIDEDLGWDGVTVTGSYLLTEEAPRQS